MNIAFVVYQISTGLVVYRGADPYGAAGQAPHLPSDQAVMDVPIEALTPGAIDFAPIRQVLAAKVDYEAELTRMKFLTPGTGQALTYSYKADEARSWTKDHDVATPFLTAEAAARDMTVADLAAEIMTSIEEWSRVGALIEAKRMAAKTALTIADGFPALAAASTVDWSVVAPAIEPVDPATPSGPAPDYASEPVGPAPATS